MDQFAFLYPPRPKKAVAPAMISYYSRKNWVGQYKKNGTCTILGVGPNKEIVVKTRHNEDHKAWAPTDKSKKAFLDLELTGWTIFVCELLNNKVADAGLKNILYVFDILVLNGEDLTGTTFTERQIMIRELFGITDTTPEDYSHWIINPNCWVAKTLTGDLKPYFDGITRPEYDEGIVIKNPNGTLEYCFKKDSNTGWQVKVRYVSKNYTF